MNRNQTWKIQLCNMKNYICIFSLDRKVMARWKNKRNISTCRRMPACFSISSIRMVAWTAEGSCSVCTWSWTVTVVYTAGTLINICKHQKRQNKIYESRIFICCLGLVLFLPIFFYFQVKFTLGIKQRKRRYRKNRKVIPVVSVFVEVRYWIFPKRERTLC